ncbi:hypothetical protein HOLleu_36831 [Holothuria leucospilota]|uniref:DDE-1 domain-containing protein n=1 Tax=Holothuria leucospilota TaxID=206669 RepID=A0A9Q0YKE0_HOLLE|nr:hypothetical protein HOLleu_36831 [Holothuria leucospilota]
MCGVPESTLRALVKRGKDTPMTGKASLIPEQHERQLKDHIIHLAKIGFPLSRSGVLKLANYTAVFLNLRKETDRPISVHWFRRFMRRWPDLQLVRLQKLGMRRPEGQQRPAIPLYFIFKGQQLSSDLKTGTLPGSGFRMTRSGWSNGEVFMDYIQNHITKYMPSCSDNDHVLFLYDGHKSHISLPLIEFALTQKIILFVPPPHTSHILQPLDVSVFGPLKRCFHSECQRYMHQNPGERITRYQPDSHSTREKIKKTTICLLYRPGGVAITESKIILKLRKVAPNKDDDCNKPGPSKPYSPAKPVVSSSGDEEVCCVCKRFLPPNLRDTLRLEAKFVDWTQCGNCGHWVHLDFCIPLRKDDVRSAEYLCPHCGDE